VVVAADMFAAKVDWALAHWADQVKNGMQIG